MSVENKKELSSEYDLQKRLDGIAYLEGLEEEYIHAHAMAVNMDPTPNKILADEIAHLHEENKLEPTFAQRNRVLTRRQSRRTAQTLIKRHL